MRFLSAHCVQSPQTERLHFYGLPIMIFETVPATKIAELRETHPEFDNACRTHAELNQMTDHGNLPSDELQHAKRGKLKARERAEGIFCKLTGQRT